MAFYPSVKPGDPFRPNAALSNDVRKLINGLSCFSAGSLVNQYFGSVRVHVYNSGTEKIRTGTFVVPDSEADFKEDVIPVTLGESNSLNVWYSMSDMEKNSVGECIVRGSLIVTAEGKGDYAMPVINSNRVKLGSEGFPVLFASGSKALINLSDINYGYQGSFPVTLTEDGKIKVGPGYLSRNGQISLVPEVSGIDPKSGILCVSSKISGDQWTTPTIGFSEVNSTSYPIAVVEVLEDNTVDIVQYPVSVAVILETKPCPLIKKS